MEHVAFPLLKSCSTDPCKIYRSGTKVLSTRYWFQYGGIHVPCLKIKNPLLGLGLKMLFSFGIFLCFNPWTRFKLILIRVGRKIYLKHFIFACWSSSSDLQETSTPNFQMSIWLHNKTSGQLFWSSVLPLLVIFHICVKNGRPGRKVHDN